MNKIKEALFSEKGMTIVNILFFLSLFLRNRGVIFAAYAVWILYLLHCRKSTHSKTARGLYSVFAVYAGAMIALNFYFLLRAR